MALMYVDSLGIQKNFIESAEGLVVKTMQGLQTNATTVGDKKVIKAGSVYPTNATGAKGIVLDDVDMTYDAKKPVAVIVAGRVYENRLAVTVNSTAKSELQAAGIHFITADEPSYTIS